MTDRQIKMVRSTAVMRLIAPEYRSCYGNIIWCASHITATHTYCT